ncbi:hypothetical protein Bca101_061212 [Brassica carinata]
MVHYIYDFRQGCFRCCCLSCVTAPKPRCHFVDPYPFKVMFQTSMGPFGLIYGDLSSYGGRKFPFAAVQMGQAFIDER